MANETFSIGAKKKEEEEEERRQLLNRENAGGAYTLPNPEHFEFQSGDVTGLPWGGYSLASLSYSNVQSDPKYSTSSQQGTLWGSDWRTADTYDEDIEMQDDQDEDEDDQDAAAEENKARSSSKSSGKKSSKKGKSRKDK
jgi:hypothetical protein